MRNRRIQVGQPEFIMTVRVNCGCGTCVELEHDRPAGAESCPTCGCPLTPPSPARRRRTWPGFVIPCLVVAALAGVLVPAVENARDAAARAH